MPEPSKFHVRFLGLARKALGLKWKEATFAFAICAVRNGANQSATQNRNCTRRR